MDNDNSGSDSGASEGKPVEEPLRPTQVDGGHGEMLDPSWTPERGRSHVAALAELAGGGRS